MAKVWNSTLNRNIPLKARSSLRKKGGSNLRFKAVRFYQRTKAVDVSGRVRHTVLLRDEGTCLHCHTKAEKMTMAHYIPRNINGLGIPENIVALCGKCHDKMDNTTYGEEHLLPRVKEYLDELYPNFKDEDRVYKNWTMKKEEIN